MKYMRRNASNRHVKVKSMDVKHTAESIETMKWRGGETTVRREEDMCKWNRRKIVTACAWAWSFQGHFWWLPLPVFAQHHCPHWWSPSFFLIFWWTRHCPWPFNGWFCSIQETWCDLLAHYPFQLQSPSWNMFPKEILHSRRYGPGPPKSLGIGTLFAGRWFKNWFN